MRKQLETYKNKGQEKNDLHRAHLLVYKQQFDIIYHFLEDQWDIVFVPVGIIEKGSLLLSGFVHNIPGFNINYHEQPHRWPFIFDPVCTTRIISKIKESLVILEFSLQTYIYL